MIVVLSASQERLRQIFLCWPSSSLCLKSAGNFKLSRKSLRYFAGISPIWLALTTVMLSFVWTNLRTLLSSRIRWIPISRAHLLECLISRPSVFLLQLHLFSKPKFYPTKQVKQNVARPACSRKIQTQGRHYSWARKSPWWMLRWGDRALKPDFTRST